MTAVTDILSLDPSEASRIAVSKARCAMFRARGLGLAEHFTGEQFLALLYSHPYCAECGTERFLTPDHIVPLKNGGSNAISNIRILCHSCNSRRGPREKIFNMILFAVSPSLKARAEVVAARKNQTLSDYAHDLLEAAVAREEKRGGKTNE